MTKDDLIGVWTSGGQEVFGSDGARLSALGPESPGWLVYTAEGYMIVLTSDPRGLPTDDPSSLTDAEKARCADACVSYFGRYEVTGGDVLHHVELALFPGWAGRTRVRHATIADGRMTFVTDPDAAGRVSHIHWRKV